MKIKYRTLIATACLSFLLMSCASSPDQNPADATDGSSSPYRYAPPTSGNSSDYSDKSETDEIVQNEVKPFIREGSGKFVTPESAAGAGSRDGQGEITLNFEAVDLREVIKIIFEEILDKNYLIDPGVQGVVTIHTTKPVGMDDVLPIFESILEMNQAALIRDGALYKIVPLANAKKMLGSPSLGSLKGLSAGHGVQIIPLRYVAASEMLKILQTISDDKDNIKSDEARNLILLSGSSRTTSNLIETIKMFDVDWLSGMSFALFPLQHTDAKTMVDDLKNIVGESGPLSGIVRLIPIERLNAVMVVSHQPRYIVETKRLIEQFDLGIDKAPGRRLYVYRLENGKAENIAEILQQIFGQDSTRQEARSSASRDSRKLSNIRSAERSSIQSPTTAAKTGGDTGDNRSVATTASSVARTADDSQGESRYPVTIIADNDNNSILVLASSQDYKKIQSTIKRLDVAPRQVLIEATIAEVQLSNNLSYGIRWFLEGGSSSHPIDVGFNAPLPTGIGGDGLSLGIFNSVDQLRALFDLLESESTVKFLSAPHILVVDNQTATFRVGDQIPINTRTTQSTVGADSPIVSEFQYRDTGTLLQVTPRINAGGMITLEINQEVSSPGAAASGDNPPIAQRTIDSTVIVHSGQSIVLGGMIRENLLTGKDGIPLLKDIPLLGGLFSSTTENVSRTELIVTLTPRVVTDPNEVYELSKELRTKLKEAASLESDYRYKDVDNTPQ